MLEKEDKERGFYSLPAEQERENRGIQQAGSSSPSRDKKKKPNPQERTKKKKSPVPSAWGEKRGGRTCSTLEVKKRGSEKREREKYKKLKGGKGQPSHLQMSGRPLPF